MTDRLYVKTAVNNHLMINRIQRGEPLWKKIGSASDRGLVSTQRIEEPQS